MDGGIHFISGLPRSGSTLLSAILKQNPAIYAHMTSPVGSMVAALLADMSQGNETSIFIDNEQRARIFKGLFQNFYHADHPTKTVFDTNRGWTARVDLLASLFPGAKIICCVRHVPWIIDSIERLLRKNPFELSRIFDFDRGGTVYSRAEGLMASGGMVGFALNGLKQALHGAEASRLLLLPYETLVSEPKATLRSIYEFTGLPAFDHDFENIAFDATEFDARLGTPGLHDIRPRAVPQLRQTILPPDVWQKYHNASFWISRTDEVES